MVVVGLLGIWPLPARSQDTSGPERRITPEVAVARRLVLVGAEVNFGKAPAFAAELLAGSDGALGSLSVLYGYGQPVRVYVGVGVGLGIGGEFLVRVLTPRAGVEWPLGSSVSLRAEFRGFLAGDKSTLAFLLGVPVG